MHMDLTRRSFLIILQVSFCQLWPSSPGITVRALRGSCAVIPCAFTNPEPRRAISSFQWWKRKDGEEHEEIIYQYNKTSAAVEGYRDRTALVGDVDNGTCSLQINNVRSEDAARYYLWIEPITDRHVLHTLHVSDSPEELSLSDPGVMTEGRSVVITCSAVHTCPPRPPSLTWVRHSGNASIHQEDLRDGRWRAVSKINYSPSSEDHGKSLQCNATYPENIISTKSITFNITYPPKNTSVVVLGIMNVKEGDNVTLTCSAAGNPSVFNYSWYEGQQKAPLQNHKQQMILMNIMWDSGPYSCTAQNEVGTGESTPLDLDVQYPPKNATVDVSRTAVVKEGDTVTLTCSAVGNPAVYNYSWYEGQKKEPLQNQKQQMTLMKIRWDSGPYYCTANNEVGAGESAPLDLHIQYPPKKTAVIISGNTTVKEGDTVTLTCSAVGNPSVFNYSWYEGQQRAPLQNKGQQMILKNIAWDSGPYSCGAQNEVGTGEFALLDLRVQHAPKGIQVTAERKHIEGKPLNLTCSTNSSNPEVTHYTWHKDMVQLPNQSQTLQLKNMTAKNSGKYRCTAHNKLGNSSSSPFIVDVLYAPKGARVDAPMTDAVQGEIMILTCETNSGNPAVANYIWYKNRTQIESQVGKTLKFRVTTDDSGHYHCVAHNEAGNSSSAPITVQVGTSPGSPLVPVAGAVCILMIMVSLFIFVFITRRKRKLGAAVPGQSVTSNCSAQQESQELVYCTIDHSRRSQRQGRAVPCDDIVTYAAVACSSESKPPVGPAAMNKDDMYGHVKKPARPPKAQQDTEELNYGIIDHSKWSRRKRRTVPPDDSVTYAAVTCKSESIPPVGPAARNSDDIYAQVKKPARPPKKN